MAKNNVSQYMTTVNKLREKGKSFIEASKLAELDMNINQWPKDWGDDLVVSIYGFIEINVEVELPDLGISIKPEKVFPKKEGVNFVFGAP